jgi:hypothetical protein
MRAIIILLFLAFIPTANADDGIELPVYDVDRNCADFVHRLDAQTVAEGGKTTDELAGFSRRVTVADIHARQGKECVYSEQQSYDHLKAIWPIVPDVTKIRALRELMPKVSKDNAMKYSFLKECIDGFWMQDKEQADRAAQGVFKR